MSVGEKVLALLSTDSNKLLMQWKRPYEIVENQGKVIYTIDMNGKVKTFHANMFKLYDDGRLWCQRHYFSCCKCSHDGCPGR